MRQPNAVSHVLWSRVIRLECCDDCHPKDTILARQNSPHTRKSIIHGVEILKHGIRTTISETKG